MYAVCSCHVFPMNNALNSIIFSVFGSSCTSILADLAFKRCLCMCVFLQHRFVFGVVQFVLPRLAICITLLCPRACECMCRGEVFLPEALCRLMAKERLWLLTEEQ